MDILKIYKNNQKENEEFEITKKEYELKKEINKLIGAIVKDEKEFFTKNEKLIEVLNIKCKLTERTTFSGWGCSTTTKDYKILINERVVKKVDEYLKGADD